MGGGPPVLEDAHHRFRTPTALPANRQGEAPQLALGTLQATENCFPRPPLPPMAATSPKHPPCGASPQAC